MAWTRTVTQEQNTQNFTITVSDTEGKGISALTNQVGFYQISNLGIKSLDLKNYRDDEDSDSFLKMNVSDFLSQQQIDAGFSLTLDLSGVTGTGVSSEKGLLVRLPKYSTHYRPYKADNTLDDVSSDTLGSNITTIIGTDADDNIIGSALDEVIDGGGGNDYLQGNSGDDTLKGGDGDDVITSGGGNDNIDGGAGTDTLWHRWISAGEDRSVNQSLVDITEDNNYTGDYATEAAAFKALSEANGDFGDDQVTLWVDLNDGYSFSYFSMDYSVFNGEPIPEQYQEGLRKNIITNTENVTANAQAGFDSNGVKIVASVILEGNADGNELIGGVGDDWIWGNGGDDRIHSKNNDDTIYGGDGGDVINAGWGDDILFGEDGADRLIGNKGEDVLHGGAGNDTLIGGQGADKFVIDLTTAGDNGSDIIEDFIKVKDKIVFVTDNGDEADLAALGVEITYINTGSERYSEIADNSDTNTVYAKIMNKNLTNDGYDIGDSSGYFELVSATDEIVPVEV